MSFRPAHILTILTLVLTAGLGSSEETKTAPKAAVRPGHKVKKALRHKLVDLNSATKEQLKKLPGITDELAAKIIAARPYVSKAHLVTHNIISSELYYPIKDRVAALQPKAGKR